MENVYAKPGYQIRRLRQIAAALFAREAASFGITGQQYTTLEALNQYPRLEQGELCDLLSLDRSTMATLLVRLEEKLLVRRVVAPNDKRRKYVSITPQGRRLLAKLGPAAEAINVRLLEPLAPEDRIVFRRLLKTLVTAHERMLEKVPSKDEVAS